MKIIFLIAALLFASTLSLEIRCDTKTIKKYDYETKTLQNSTTTRMKATYEIWCVKKFKNTNKLLFHIKFLNGKIDQISNEGTKTDELTNKLGRTSGFTIFTNGKLDKIFHSNNEHTYYTHLKKSVIELFQTSLDVDKRTEVSLKGNITRHYQRKIEEDDKTIIEGKDKTADLVEPADPRQKRRDVAMHNKIITELSPKGDVLRVYKEESANYDENTSKRDEKEFENQEKTVGWGNEGSDTEINMMNAKSTSVVELIEEHKVEVKYSYHERRSIHNTLGVQHENDDELNEHLKKNNFQQSTFTKSKEYLDFLDGLEKEKMKKDYSFEKIIDELVVDPKNLKLLGRAQNYLGFFSEKVEYLQQVYLKEKTKEGWLKSENSVEFMKDYQALLATTRSLKAQTYLIDSLRKSKNVNEIHHGLIQIASIFDAQKVVTDYLRELITKGVQLTDVSADRLEVLKNNAYLILSRLAHSMKDQTRKSEIVNEIIGNIKKSNGAEKTFHLHALGNAGEGVSLYVVKSFLKDSSLTLEQKKILISSLEHRINNKEVNEKVDKFIHLLVHNEKVHDSLKVEAVKTQTKRENQIQNGASVQSFKEAFIKLGTPELKSEIINYFKTENGHESRSILSMANSNTLGVIDNVKASIADAFSAASDAYTERCYSTKNERLCMKGPLFQSRMSYLGTISTLQSRSVIFERFIGVKAFHLYLGFFGMMGVNPSNFYFKANANGVIFGKILNRHVEVLDGLIRVSYGPGYNDKLYLRVGTVTLVDGHLITSYSGCLGTTTKTLSQSRRDILSVTFTFRIGPFDMSFGVTVWASAGSDAVYGLCIAQKKASFGVKPSVSLGVTCRANIGVIVADAGVNVDASSSWSLTPKTGVGCNKLCGVFSFNFNPLTIKVTVYVKGRLGTGLLDKNWVVFEKALLPSTTSSINQCVQIPGLAAAASSCSTGVLDYEGEDETLQYD